MSDLQTYIMWAFFGSLFGIVWYLRGGGMNSDLYNGNRDIFDIFLSGAKHAVIGAIGGLFVGTLHNSGYLEKKS